jgi:anti-anti-sigma regulatory factor
MITYYTVRELNGMSRVELLEAWTKTVTKLIGEIRAKELTEKLEETLRGEDRNQIILRIINMQVTFKK